MSRETVAWVTAKPCSIERVDDLALAADRRGSTTSSRIARWRSRLSSWSAFIGARRRRSRGAHVGRRGPADDPRPEGRVGRGRARGAFGADESAMIASEPSQPSAPSAARTLGTMPPAMTPDSMSVSASPAVSVSSRRPSASRTPSTSVSRTSWRAPSPAAIPAAASSALTLQTIPSASRASGATTGTWPPTRIASSRSRRRPTTLRDEPEVGDPLGDEQAAVDAGQADGVDAEVAQARRRARC